jgi:indolepyruvate ferredoxin oxidoreductase, alpha subunit
VHSRLLRAEPGLKVLVLRQTCALVKARESRTPPRPVRIDPDRCLGDTCGCNRLCTRVFGCPGLTWDAAAKKTRVDQALCTGCGVCTQICPAGAISPEDPPC